MRSLLISAAALVTVAAAVLTTAPATAGERVWMVGDSITLGHGVVNDKRDGLGAQVRTRICGGTECSRAEYVGLGGQCLVLDGCNGYPRMLDTIDDVLAEEPTVVVIEVGRNDLCHFADADLRRGYRAIARKVRDAGARPFISTLTPVNERWAWPCEDQRVRTNGWIRATFRNVVDLEPVVSDAAGQLDLRFDSGDGLHPNRLGSRLLAREVVRELRSFGVHPRRPRT